MLMYVRVLSVAEQDHDSKEWGQIAGVWESRIGLYGFWWQFWRPCGRYMYHQYNSQQFYVLPTQCIYVFCVDLRTNSDYFPIEH